MDWAKDEKNISGQGHKNELDLWPFGIQESSSVGKIRKVPYWELKHTKLLDYIVLTV